jgi:hypothetical protein
MPTTSTNALSFLLGQKLQNEAQLKTFDTILRGAQILQYIPVGTPSHFMQDQFYETVEAETSSIQALGLNQSPDYSYNDQQRLAQEPLQKYGDGFKINEDLDRAMPNAADEQARQKTELFFRKADWDIINGTIDNKGLGFRGLKARSNSSNTIGTASTPLDFKASAANFKELVRRFREAVDNLAGSGQVLAFMDVKTKTAMSAGRDNWGAESIGVDQIDFVNRRILNIDDVPILGCRNGDTSVKPIFPHTETKGGSPTCTSIYIMRVANAPQDAMMLGSGVSALSAYEQFIKETQFTEHDFTSYEMKLTLGLRAPANSFIRLDGLQTV